MINHFKALQPNMVYAVAPKDYRVACGLSKNYGIFVATNKKSRVCQYGEKVLIKGILTVLLLSPAFVLRRPFKL